jgi:hypothetical protein
MLVPLSCWRWSVNLNGFIAIVYKLSTPEFNWGGGFTEPPDNAQSLFLYYQKSCIRALKFITLSAFHIFWATVNRRPTIGNNTPSPPRFRAINAPLPHGEGSSARYIVPNAEQGRGEFTTPSLPCRAGVGTPTSEALSSEVRMKNREAHHDGYEGEKNFHFKPKSSTKTSHQEGK